MRKIVRTFFFGAFIIVVLVASSDVVVAQNEQKFYLGELYNTGKDTGYEKRNSITEKDPHYGWKLGDFYVDGYTRVIEENKDNPVFLKTVGDTIKLWFRLEQDLNKLNNNGKLAICADSNGYNEHFGIQKTNFGKGTLIIQHTDYQNYKHTPVIYTNYLEANAKQGANVEVQLLEEGDYEIALCYEIQETPFEVFGADMFPNYTNYIMTFKFSIRNGNCMVFPFDASTGEELTNCAYTKNGFYLDLANSRFLDINVKKEVLNDSVDGLVEDVRFNRPAKDGDKYTEDGVYTITVKNSYTNEQTVKKIYVGSNEILRAHVVTNQPVSYIKEQLSNGATISNDGQIVPPEPQTEIATESTTEVATEESVEDADNEKSNNWWVWILVGIILVGTIVFIVVILYKKKITNKMVDANEE